MRRIKLDKEFAVTGITVDGALSIAYGKVVIAYIYNGIDPQGTFENSFCANTFSKKLCQLMNDNKDKLI